MVGGQRRNEGTRKEEALNFAFASSHLPKTFELLFPALNPWQKLVALAHSRQWQDRGGTIR